VSDEQSPFDRLVAIMHRLRAPGGCPWDAAQTHASLRPYLIEEAYEVLDAIDARDDESLREELGDLLLQVVFHAELASERGAFRIDQIIEGLSSKLVRRHPHVFESASADSSAEVERNWASIKAEERRARGATNVSAIDGVPRALPALLRAHRLGEKAACVGFDWDSPEGARRKVTEELAEADAADGNPEAFAEEIGDLLFAVVNWARLSRVHAEGALHEALQKFEGRFRALETEVSSGGGTLTATPASELDALWNALKHRQPTGTLPAPAIPGSSDAERNHGTENGQRASRPSVTADVAPDATRK
jgi:tetrapyrrole methylase family protein/MazG family protein